MDGNGRLRIRFLFAMIANNVGANRNGGSMSDLMGIIAEGINLAEKFRDLEFKEKMRILRQQVLELQEENLQLKNRLRSREEMTASGPNNYFYRDVPNAAPHCPVCWQRDEKAVLLPAVQEYFGGPGRLCRVCKTMFDEGPRKQQVRAVRHGGVGGSDSWMGN
jgi:hypothetical protein